MPRRLKGDLDVVIFLQLPAHPTCHSPHIGPAPKEAWPNRKPVAQVLQPPRQSCGQTSRRHRAGQGSSRHKYNAFRFKKKKKEKSQVQGGLAASARDPTALKIGTNASCFTGENVFALHVYKQIHGTLLQYPRYVTAKCKGRGHWGYVLVNLKNTLILQQAWTWTVVGPQER